MAIYKTKSLHPHIASESRSNAKGDYYIYSNKDEDQIIYIILTTTRLEHFTIFKNLNIVKWLLSTFIHTIAHFFYIF